MIYKRIFRSWKNTLFALLIAGVVTYLIIEGIAPIETAIGYLWALAHLFRLDKSVKQELKQNEEKYARESARMSDTDLRDDVQRMSER